MPILDVNAPEFAGFDLDAEFQSALHSEDIAPAGKVSKFYRDLSAETSVYQQWKNFSRLSRHTVGSIGITTGLPRTDLTPLSDFFHTIPKVGKGDIAGAIIRNLVLKGALLVVDTALDAIATKVPVVGWVLQVGLFFYDLIRLAITGVEKEPDQAQAMAIAYSKENDQSFAQSLLNDTSNLNWTRFFLPQFRPVDVNTVTLAYTSRGAVDGIAWEVSDPGADSMWGWGLTPGLSSKFTGAIGVYQSPRYLIGSVKCREWNWNGTKCKSYRGRDAGVESITSFGNLHPTVVQFGLMAWQMCLKNSPIAFRINGDRIASAWMDHFGELWNWAYTVNNDEWLREQIKVSTQWWDPWFEVSRVEYMSGGKNLFGHPSDLPNKYTSGDLFWYAQLIQYFIDEVWKPRLSGYLETLTVAYVPVDAPALKMSDALKQKHHDMRQLLLQHNARYEVEVPLIPDDGSGFKQAMVEATGWPAIKPAMTAHPDTINVDPGKPPPPEPPTNPAPATSPLDLSWLQPGKGRRVAPYLMIGGGALVAATAASYYYWDDLISMLQGARRRLPGGVR